MNVVLSGGAGISVASFAAFQALSDKNIKPQTIMATSSGAIFGFFLAA